MKDPGNTRRNAKNIGVLSGTRRFNDFVGLKDKNDFYQFSLNSSSNTFTLRGLRNNANLALLDQNGRRIAISKRGGRRNEKITRNLGPGTYFIRVFRKQGETSYQLTMQSTPSVAPPPPPPPPAAPNGVIRLPAGFSSSSIPSQALIYDVVIQGTVSSFTGQQNFQRAGRLFLTRSFPIPTVNGRNLFEVGLLSSNSTGNVSGTGGIRFATNTALFGTGGNKDAVFQTANPSTNVLAMSVDRTAEVASNQFSSGTGNFVLGFPISIASGNFALGFQGNSVAGQMNFVAAGGSGQYAAQLSGNFIGTIPF